jgi:hypothetical protein
MPSKVFPPLGKQNLENHIKIGKRARTIKSVWGDYEISIQRWEEKGTAKQGSTPVDASLDSSDWTPWALERLLDLAHRLPFEEAAIVAGGFGLPVTSAELERLTHAYSQTLEESVMESLVKKSEMPLEKDFEKAPRIMALELDGVRVQGQPVEGVCEGVELKTALVYSVNRPSERTRVAGVIKAKDFVNIVAGLLRQAGVRQQDQIVALSDGATWIADLLELLGVLQILDVFHAAEYFEKVLMALGWDDELRSAERCLLLRGEIDMGVWLSTFLRTANVSSWNEEARIALQYLLARTHLMTYPTFKARGYPIGSGQIEGMNKSVIGSRMKRSGMQWSRDGASRMGAFRAERLSYRPVSRFHALRFKAFPPKRVRGQKVQVNPQS